MLLSMLNVAKNIRKKTFEVLRSSDFLRVTQKIDKMSSGLEIDVQTNDPTSAWERLRPTQNVIRFKLNHKEEDRLPADKIRFVCMSDTHSLTSHIKREIPIGDVFIHAGDFTRSGTRHEVREFNRWLAKLPHKRKIVVAGNHELTFDKSRQKLKNPEEDPRSPRSRSAHVGDGGGVNFLNDAVGDDVNMRDELTNCDYLEDSATRVLGLNVYGTPWQPEFGGWAFNLPRGRACLDKWDLIPDATDVLITHTPPLGFGDRCCTGVRAGCAELLTTVQKRVRPKYHVYGHIHEGYGLRSDGRTVYVNASTCDINYAPNNRPIVFDVAFPPGYSRQNSIN